MSHDPHNLYNFKRPKLHDPNVKELSSSINLAFSSTLSSLLTSTPSSTTRGRPRPSKEKEDIFKSHNKGAKKRAAKDLEDDEANDNGYTRIKTTSSAVDENALHRSKRRLEAKAKIYKRLKRGEHDAEENDEALIDFDRKWAENGEKDDSESDADGNATAEMVEYEDEFGRLRKGTAAEAARMARKKAARLHGAEELVQMSARPSMPSTLIHGDTIQSSAFTTSLSDDKISKMEELAQKRDRSATPPEMRHYEADAEDEKARAEEMRGLEELRRGTEEVRRGREDVKERRRREVEERRRALGEKRAKRQAERFLEGLDVGGGLGGGAEDVEEGKGEGRGE
ncbi:hypothetical protein ACMFMG_003086 [Clarireedia jacksonii]